MASDQEIEKLKKQLDEVAKGFRAFRETVKKEMQPKPEGRSLDPDPCSGCIAWTSI